MNFTYDLGIIFVLKKSLYFQTYLLDFDNLSKLNNNKITCVLINKYKVNNKIRTCVLNQ